MNMSTDSVRVLHVDDDPLFAELVATVLEEEYDRFVVETATSATEALDQVEATDIDCIVSDYQMPGHDGIELLESVREECHELPFILLTAKGSEGIASDAISAGVTDYLQKDPTTNGYTELANRINNAVETVADQRERQRHLDTVETARVGVSIVDNDRFSYVNKPFADLYGYDPSEMIDEHWELIYPAEEAASIRTEALPTVRDTGEWYGQTVGLCADGHTFTAEQSITRTDDGTLVWTVQDLTERENRESRLGRTLTRLELAIEGANIGIWDWNMRTDEVQFNEKWAKMLGYTVEELDPHLDTWQRRVHPDDLDAVNEAVQAHVDGDSPYYDTEHRMRTADGDWKWIHDIGTIVERDDAGEPVRAVGIHLDVNDQKEHEREVKQEKQRLEEFTRIMSHDLRNPLQVAMGNVELAKDGRDNEYLDTATEALDRIEELIDDLLQLARSGHQLTGMETVELPTLIDRCWQNVETPDATLVSTTEQTVRADKSRLSQLLENLFRNAVEHGGANVTVTVGDLETGFYVQDDGPGIPDADQSDVLAVGYSTSAEGTGFGLSIVKQVAQAHDWTLSVTNSAEGGARFEITNVEIDTA